MGAHGIHHLVQQYGCLLVFVAVASQAFGLPLPGTTVLVAAAVYAAAGHGLPIEGVIVAGAAGALVGTTAGFAVGRWGGERLLVRVGARLRIGAARVEQLRHGFAERGTVLLFISRFVTGLRNVAGLVAGASGMDLKRFLPISAAAAVAWATINALEYYWFGHALLGASTWVRVVLVCAGFAWLVVSFGLVRRRALRRLPAAPATGSPN